MKIPALAVFAKEPRPGLVKTRLSPPLSPKHAADFYRAMLADVLNSTARAATVLGAAPFLFVDPRGALPKMLAQAPAEFVGLPQEGAGLGARMDQAFEHLFKKGYSPILLRGSDSPGVTVQAIERFLEALKTHDVVFGPDSNGGYYLIGMHSPEPRMFEVALSNKEVLPRSLEVARGLGLSVKTLEPSFDINTASDLSFLKLGAGTDEARKSVAFATHHNLWRHLPA